MQKKAKICSFSKINLVTARKNIFPAFESQDKIQIECF